MDDALPFLQSFKLLQDDFNFADQSQTYSLDFREANQTKMQELLLLVSAVLQKNQNPKGTNFKQPQYFPFYIQQLEDLKQILLNHLRN